MMLEMMNEIKDMGNELRDLAQKQENIPENLQKAISKAGKTADPLYDQSPEAVISAFIVVENEARNANNKEIADFAGEKKSALQDKIVEARRNGILTDEALTVQLKSQNRKGRQNIDDAIIIFDGAMTGANGERTPEAQNLIDTAKKLSVAQHQLGALDKNINDPMYFKQSQEVIKLSGETSKAAMDYVKKNGMNPTSMSEKVAMVGAMDLFRESEMVKVGLKKEAIMNMAEKRMQAENTKGEKTNKDVKNMSFDDLNNQVAPAEKAKAKASTKRAARTKNDFMLKDPLHRGRGMV